MYLTVISTLGRREAIVAGEPHRSNAGGAPSTPIRCFVQCGLPAVYQPFLKVSQIVFCPPFDLERARIKALSSVGI